MLSWRYIVVYLQLLMPSINLTSESPESSFQSIAIEKIRIDGGTQPRSQLIEEVVAEYADDMKQGATFPPVTIFYDGKEYWLADGFHRVQARASTGSKEVVAEVISGSRRDAVLFAVGANAVHGLRRTNADKRRAVERLLRDREWSKWSNVEIAKKCQVNEKTVRNIRKQLTSENPKIDIDPSQRVAMRGGTIIEMDTTNIGTKPQAKAKESLQRRRAKKQPITSATYEVESPNVAEGDTWKLGKSHYLFCGDLSSKQFQKLLPSKIALFLVFPQTRESWTQAVPENAMNALSFYTSYGDDIDLKNLRLMLENCLFTTTESDDPIVVSNIPDSLLFILMESLFCCCYCADSDPQRCTEALKAWSAINQPLKKL